MDNKRVDLSEKFSSIHDESFLNDLSQVAKRKSEEKAQSARKELKKKDNKLQTIIVACAAVVLLVVAYFAVFSTNKTSDMASNDIPIRVAPRSVQSQPTQTVSSRKSRFNSAGNPNARATSPRRSNSRAGQAPAQGYEQPHDSGM